MLFSFLLVFEMRLWWVGDDGWVDGWMDEGDVMDEGWRSDGG